MKSSMLSGCPVQSSLGEVSARTKSQNEIVDMVSCLHHLGLQKRISAQTGETENSRDGPLIGQEAEADSLGCCG